MHWIIQNNIFNEYAFDEVIKVFEDNKISYSIHKVIPFIGDIEPTPNLINNNVMVLGSFSLVDKAIKEGWKPGAFDLTSFHFKEQLKRWGHHMLNSDSKVCSLNDVVFDDEIMFIRPIHDSKAFPGKCFFKEDFYEWKKAMLEINCRLTESTLVQVAKPKKIYLEARFWVIDGVIVTSSLYRIGKTIQYQNLPNNSEIEAFAKARISEWQPARAFVIDIADCESGFKIVEINTINACGFYASDVKKLITTLHEKFSNETNEIDKNSD